MVLVHTGLLLVPVHETFKEFSWARIMYKLVFGRCFLCVSVLALGGGVNYDKILITVFYNRTISKKMLTLESNPDLS